MRWEADGEDPTRRIDFEQVRRARAMRLPPMPRIPFPPPVPRRELSALPWPVPLPPARPPIRRTAPASAWPAASTTERHAPAGGPISRGALAIERWFASLRTALGRRGREKDTSVEATMVVAVAVSVLLAIAVCAVSLASQRGDLHIEVRGTTGVRARISVDGVQRCEVTPCVVREVAPGPHTVQVSAPGFGERTLTSVVEPRKRAIVDVDLEPPLADCTARMARH